MVRFWCFFRRSSKKISACFLDCDLSIFETFFDISRGSRFFCGKFPQLSTHIFWRSNSRGPRPSEAETGLLTKVQRENNVLIIEFVELHLLLKNCLKSTFAVPFFNGCTVPGGRGTSPTGSRRRLFVTVESLTYWVIVVKIIHNVNVFNKLLLMMPRSFIYIVYIYIYVYHMSNIIDHISPQFVIVDQFLTIHYLYHVLSSWILWGYLFPSVFGKTQDSRPEYPKKEGLRTQLH